MIPVGPPACPARLLPGELDGATVCSALSRRRIAVVDRADFTGILLWLTPKVTTTKIGGTLQAPPSSSSASRPPGQLACSMARAVSRLEFSDSTHGEFYDLGRTREPLYFGPRLPQMGKSCQNRV